LACRRTAIDSPQGRALCSRRIATVESVFANIRHQGDAGGLKGKKPTECERGGKRALTRHGLQGSIRAHQRAAGEP